MLGTVIAGQEFEASIVVRFFNAYAENDEIVLDNGHRLPMLRQQKNDAECLSLTDYIRPKAEGTSCIGLFTLKVEDRFRCQDCRDFDHLLREALCSRLTEALAEWMQEQVGDTPGIRLFRLPRPLAEKRCIRPFGCAGPNRSKPHVLLCHHSHHQPLRNAYRSPGSPVFQHQQNRQRPIERLLCQTGNR